MGRDAPFPTTTQSLPVPCVQKPVRGIIPRQRARRGEGFCKVSCGFMPVIALPTPICVVSFQAADLTARWTATWVGVGTALSMTGRVTAETISTATFEAREATSTMGRGPGSSERCS
ncbi:hypothetical protein ACB098_07G025600 [Castanea mollissima]